MVIDWLSELYGQPQDPVLQSLIENGPSTPATNALQSLNQGQDSRNELQFNPVTAQNPAQITPTAQQYQLPSQPATQSVQEPAVEEKINIEGAKYSKNNPMLAYVPGPKNIFRKFIGMSNQWKAAAQQWENENAPKQQPLQQQQQKMTALASKTVLEALNNPEIAQTNGNKLNLYGTILNSPGGEMMAQDILKEVLGMYNTKPTQEMTPMDQAKLARELLGLELDKKKLLDTGNESNSDLNRQYQQVQDDYVQYVRTVKARDQYAVPLNYTDWIRQPENVGALRVFNQYRGDNLEPLLTKLSTKTPEQVQQAKQQAKNERQELLQVNAKYGVNIPSYAAAKKLLEEAARTGVDPAKLAKKKYPKKKK